MNRTLTFGTILPRSIDDESLLHGVCVLADTDPDLRKIVDELGPPPLWSRDPGFPTLVRIMLEQQVSLASAHAAFERLLALATPLSLETFMEPDEATLRRIGFSRQKALYGRHLADSILSGYCGITI